eukprot:TRINITY_DN8829_c0_g1_i2.p1 TRINITY_DN8829_c0_g1~~TRINITY_DN8829_c0_g1_i2.p1  ORF type:complete len:194 (+),score=14.00 TRINITY_DN8829_c0_g1_i2:353-934(+)
MIVLFRAGDCVTESEKPPYFWSRLTWVIIFAECSVAGCCLVYGLRFHDFCRMEVYLLATMMLSNCFVWFGAALVIVYWQNELTFHSESQQVQVPMVRRMRWVTPVTATAVAATLLYCISFLDTICDLFQESFSQMNSRARWQFLVMNMGFLVLPTTLSSFVFGTAPMGLTLVRHQSFEDYTEASLLKIAVRVE